MSVVSVVGLAVASGVAAAGPDPDGVRLIDGAWTVSGSSFFDPDTSMGGDELDDSANAPVSIPPGSSGSVGGGGTSSGPFSAAFSWSFTLNSARGAIGYPWVLDLDLSKQTSGLIAPMVDGGANVSLDITQAIIFEVLDDGLGTPLRFEESDAFGNVTLSVVSGEPGGINGDEIMPGVYQLELGSGFFSASNSDGVQDGHTITDTALVDYSLRIIPAPGGVALLALGGLVAARRRRSGVSS